MQWFCCWGGFTAVTMWWGCSGVYLNFSDLGTHFLNIAYLACEYFGPLVAVLPTILSKQSYCCRYFAFRPAQAASITFEHTADACDGCQQCQVTLQGLLRSTILAIAYSMSQVLPLALAAWRAWWRAAIAFNFASIASLSKVFLFLLPFGRPGPRFTWLRPCS